MSEKTERCLTFSDLEKLYESRCECRPTDILRTSHSHDCDTECTDLITEVVKLRAERTLAAMTERSKQRDWPAAFAEAIADATVERDRLIHEREDWRARALAAESSLRARPAVDGDEAFVEKWVLRLFNTPRSEIETMGGQEAYVRALLADLAATGRPAPSEAPRPLTVADALRDERVRRGEVWIEASGHVPASFDLTFTTQWRYHRVGRFTYFQQRTSLDGEPLPAEWKDNGHFEPYQVNAPATLVPAGEAP